MKKLNESQLKNFDNEYVKKEEWAILTSHIKKAFPRGEFHLLDVGGGNGMLADKILDFYPNSMVTLIDNSDFLLSQNVIRDRKVVHNMSAENIEELKDKYDIISINWVLHHLVSDTYSESRKNINGTLCKLKSMLKPGGFISVFENIYDGQIIQWLPSYLIFYFTRSKALSSLTSRMGANTAGVGVCFLSKKQWDDEFKRADLKIASYADSRAKPKQFWLKKFVLHLGNIRHGHYWLK